MDAEANGCSSNEANRFAGSSPSSSLNSLCTSPVSAGGTRSSRLRNSRRHLLAERAGAGRDDLAELDVGRAQVGERLGDLLDDLLLQGAAADRDW